MQLDAPTLFVVAIIVMAVIGLLLIWTWGHNREVNALAWWGVALLLQSLGTTLVFLRGLIPDWLSIDVSNSLLIAAYGLIWNGARLFNGRTVHPSLMLGVAIWLLTCQFGSFYSSLPARAGLFSILIGSYAILAAWEFWRGTEPLASRPAVVACLILHAFMFFVHIPALTLGPSPQSAQPLDGSWFIYIPFQGIVHNIAASFLLLAMAKERVELRYKMASRIDPLTETFNRRSFVDSAKRITATVGQGSRSVALLLFDLDHFKLINDRLGHQSGDEVLKLFCRIASTHLKSSDVFGRLGGEEFAALLPGADAARARKVANAILSAFETAGQGFAHPGMAITASAGIAVSGGDSSSFEDLFTVADRGLYKAKRIGRNRVEEDFSSVIPGSLFSPQMTPRPFSVAAPTTDAHN